MVTVPAHIAMHPTDRVCGECRTLGLRCSPSPLVRPHATRCEVSMSTSLPRRRCARTVPDHHGRAPTDDTAAGVLVNPSDTPSGYVDPDDLFALCNQPDDIPHAGVDAVTHRRCALSVAALVIDVPIVAQCVLIALDDQRRGLGMVVVDDAGTPDDIIEVMTATSHAIHRSGARAIVAVSVRPDYPVTTGDEQRWNTLDAICTAADIHLVDWLIVSDIISWQCPLVEVTSRWHPDGAPG